MFFKENIIESLPLNILGESTFDVEFLLSTSRQSKSWNSLFKNPSIWMHRLSKDFGIEVLMLDQFSKESKKNPLFYKELYRSLYCLTQKRNLPTFLKSFINDITKENLLLLAQLNNTDELANIPCDEQYMIMLLLIYTNRKIPDQFLKENKDKELLHSLLEHSANAGNLQMVKYLLDSSNKFGLELNRCTLDHAAQSGNLPLMQCLFEFGLTPNIATLNCAAKSGNLELVKDFLKPGKYTLTRYHQNTLNCAAKSGNLQLLKDLLDSDFGLIPNQGTLDAAAESGNLQMVKFLLDAKYQSELKPKRSTLIFALYSGNLPLVQYLLDPVNKFGLIPDQDTLGNGAQSGNLQMVKYLLKLANQFKLTPNQHMLNRAARSGNLQLLKFLLKLANEFGLKPNQDTLNAAAHSGNIQIVKFLLNPANQFGLTCNTATINWATSGPDNLELLRHLLPSHMVIQEALEKLQEGDVDSAKTALEKASSISHSHFNFILENIVNNIEKSGLNDTAIQCLKNIVNLEEHVSGEFFKP